MWRALVAAAGLFVGVAFAAPPVETPDLIGPAEAPAQAGPFGTADPVDAAKEKLEEKKTKEEKKQKATAATAAATRQQEGQGHGKGPQPARWCGRK